MPGDEKLLPAYLAVGKNELKRQRSLDLFRGRLSGPFAEFDFDEVTASREMDGEGLSRILASLEQFPMGGLRLVVIRDAQELPKVASDALADYLKAPNPEASLLLLAERMDRRSRLYKAVRSLGDSSIIDCEPPESRKLPSHVQQMARELGFSADYEAARELIDRVGGDPTMLSRTLRTLRELAPDVRRLDRRIVEEQVSRVERPRPWFLANALAARDVGEALRLLNAMDPDDSIAAFTLCSQRIRELIVARELDPRTSPDELARVLNGMRPVSGNGKASGKARQGWQVRTHIEDSRRFTRAELVDALAKALECESALKGSRDSKSAFVSWILDVCVPASAR